jgi:hypothetical protein
MTKVYVIGDCHTARVSSHHILENVGKNFLGKGSWAKDRTITGTDIDFNMWGLSGYKIWDANFYKDHAENTLCSPAEDIPELPPITDNLLDVFGFSEIKGADIVMPWMGYIDCRTYLAKYKNTEELVQQYVDKTLDFFSESKIRFIEPFPQFDFLGTYNYHEGFNHKQKTQENDLFIELLHKYSDKAGLMTPVSQSIVYDSVGADKLTKRNVRQGGEYHDYTLLDALRPEYNKKIYHKLIEEVKNTVSFYID